MIDQIFVFALALIAWDVAVGLMQKKNMWKHIVVYWCVLTMKNFVSWIGGFV
jgi:hypothetical protein